MPVTANDLKTLPLAHNANTVVTYMNDHHLKNMIVLFQGDSHYIVSGLIEKFTHSLFSHIGLIQFNQNNQAVLCESIMHTGARCIELQRLWSGYDNPGSGKYGGMVVFARFPEQLDAAKVQQTINKTIQDKVTYNLCHDIDIGLREVYYDLFCQAHHPHCNSWWPNINIAAKSMMCSEYVKHAWDASNPNNIARDSVTKSYLPKSFAIENNINGALRANLTRSSATHLRRPQSQKQLCFFTPHVTTPARCHPVNPQLYTEALTQTACLSHPNQSEQSVCVDLFDQPFLNQPSPPTPSQNNNDTRFLMIAVASGCALILLCSIGMLIKRCCKRPNKLKEPLVVGGATRYVTTPPTI